MWKSLVAVRRLLDQAPDRERLDALFALSRFWENAFFYDTYAVDERWASLLHYSPEGEELTAQLADLQQEYGKPLFNWALFTKFYHDDLLFDWKKSDLESLTALLSQEIRTEKLRFPHRFGRLLYDRFNDTYDGSRTDHLTYDETRHLLEGTPQGVYQIGHLLVGPLGVLSSSEPRFKPAVRSLALWHCSDTGCRAVHRVTLDHPKLPMFRLEREISERLNEMYGRPSEWERVLIWQHRGIAWRNGRPYVDLPELIADCVLESERTSLFANALQGPDKERLRNAVASSKKKRDAEGSALDVANRLTQEEQLQLLLMLSDHALIELIDQAAAQRAFRIPVGEIRSSQEAYTLSPRDSRSNLSQLGIRSRSEDAVIRLVSCIWTTYHEASLSSELEWRIRTDSSRELRDALMEYVRREGPAEAVRHLVLASNLITKKICESAPMSLRLVLENEDKAVDRLLWKFGFNPELYEDSLERFRNRIREFRETVLSLPALDTEEARERIRGVGVNLFVSTEDFLEKFISYNVWILASDHFLDTRFRLDPDSARRLVPQFLGPRLGQGPEEVSWSTQGQNSLGTLLRYLAEAVKWMTSLSSLDRDQFKRNVDDLPFYANNPHRPFLFRHTQMWADTDPGELRKSTDGFSAIAKLFQQADVAGIRNGLDHYRDEFTFPTSDAMLASASRLQEALDRTDSGRYVPKLFWLHGRRSTRFGIVEYEYRDHLQRVLVTYGPPVVIGLLQHRYEHPVSIAPANLLGHPNSQLMFRPNDKSVYAAYWDGYPRRRRIDPDPNDLEPSMNTDAPA